jgi:hypothetical protein
MSACPQEFDHEEYEAALHRQAAHARRGLGDYGAPRRMGVELVPQIKDTRTEEEKMSDKAIVAQGKALANQWDSEDQVRNAVVAAYAGGNRGLSLAQINAVTKLAWLMQLDPSPGVGHLYPCTFKGVFTVIIGYQGYLYKAQQQHEFYYNPPREMTPEERELHGLEPGDVGAVCELIEMKRARWAKELGMPVPLIRGTSVWKKKARYDDKDKEWKSDNVPQSRSPFWVAGKNAVKDAIRQLGLGFGSFQIPTISGFEYDRESDSFSEVIDGEMVDKPVNQEPVIVETSKAEKLEVPPPVEPAKSDESEPATATKNSPLQALRETEPLAPPAGIVTDDKSPLPYKEFRADRVTVREKLSLTGEPGNMQYTVAIPNDSKLARTYSINVFTDAGYPNDERWQLAEDVASKEVLLDPPAMVTTSNGGYVPSIISVRKCTPDETKPVNSESRTPEIVEVVSETFVAEILTVRKRENDGKQILTVQMPKGGYAYGFSRKVFREAGYNTDDWKAEETRIDFIVKLEPPAEITTSKKGDSGFASIVGVKQVVKEEAA